MKIIEEHLMKKRIESRNRQIFISILDGVSAVNVAKTYGISAPRVAQIFYKELRITRFPQQHTLTMKTARLKKRSILCFEGICEQIDILCQPKMLDLLTKYDRLESLIDNYNQQSKV